MLDEILKDSRIPNFKFEGAKLGDILSGLLNIAFYIAIFLAFYWLVWGAFSYIMARGNKEDLAKSRARIIWALVGLIIVLLSFLIAQFAGQILPSRPGPGTAPVPGGGVPF